MIEICSVWEDESLLEVRITASNGKFAGQACCYTLRNEIEKLADQIKEFPRRLTDESFFTTYSSDCFSYFTVKFSCTDSSGHTLVRVKIAEIITYSNTPPVNNIAEFDITVEPAAINTFSAALNRLSKAPIGGKAVLKDSD